MRKSTSQLIREANTEQSLTSGLQSENLFDQTLIDMLRTDHG